MGSHLGGIRGGRWAARAAPFPRPSFSSILEKLNAREAKELCSILAERDPEMLDAQLLAFGRRLEGAGKIELAFGLYSTWVDIGAKAPPYGTPVARGFSPGGFYPGDLNSVAAERIQFLKGGGSFGERAERLLGDFVSSATDHRLILPLVAGSTVFSLARGLTLSRLASASPAWWSRGPGGRALAGLTGFFAETPAVVAVSSALHPGNAPFSENFGRTLLSLGALRTFAFLGRLGANRISPAAPISGLLPQFSMLTGLAASHRLEGYFGLLPDGSDPSWLDHAATLLTFQVGSHLGSRILGPRFSQFLNDSEIRGRTNPREAFPFALAGTASAGPSLRPPTLEGRGSGWVKPPVMMMEGKGSNGGGGKTEEVFGRAQAMIDRMVKGALTPGEEGKAHLESLTRILKREGWKPFLEEESFRVLTLGGMAAQGLTLVAKRAPEKISPELTDWLWKEGLRRVEPEAVGSVARLLGTLAMSDPLRIEADWINALAQVGGQYADPMVATECLIALFDILEASRGDLAEKALEAALLFLHHPNTHALPVLFKLLRESIEQDPKKIGPEAIRLLIDWRERNPGHFHAEEVLSPLLTYAIFHPGPSGEKALDYYLKLTLENPHAEKVGESLAELAMSLEKFIPDRRQHTLDRVFAWIQGAEGEFQIRALVFLGRLGRFAPGLLGPVHGAYLLKTLLKGSEEAMANHAGWALSQYLTQGGEEQVRPLVAALGKELPRVSEKMTLRGILTALEPLARETPARLSPEILKWLRETGMVHSDPDILHESGRILDSWTAAGPEPDPALKQALLQNVLGAASPLTARLSAHLLGRGDRDSLKTLLDHEVEGLRRLLHSSPHPETLFGAAHLLGVWFSHSPDNPLLGGVWNLLGLKRMEFGDKGNGISTVPAFLAGFLQERPIGETPVDIHQVPVALKVIPPSAFPQFLREEGAQGDLKVMGRSLVYSTADPEAFLVLKKATPGQAREELVREGQWLSELERLPLRSRLPRPLRDPNGAVLLLELEGGTPALPMIAPRDYYRYLDDPVLSDEEYFRGLSDSLHDAFLLSRHGILHTAPVRLFHNQEWNAAQRYTGDGGRYVLSPDMVFYYSQRSGMGRLDDWRGALQFGNMGATGLRDFEELASLRELQEQPRRWVPEFSQMRGRKNFLPLAEALLLGNHLLAATLYVGQRMTREAAGEGSEASLWKNKAMLQKYADRLLDLFSVAYGARHDLNPSLARSLLQGRADWVRLARQLAFFMTPAYVPYVEPTSDPTQFPLAEIFGEGVGISGVGGGAFGPYREGTFLPDQGWVSPDGDPKKPSLGAVNGQFPVREFEKAFGALFLPVGLGSTSGLVLGRLKDIFAKLDEALKPGEKEVLETEKEKLEQWLNSRMKERFQVLQGLGQLYLRKSKLLGPGRLSFMTNLERAMLGEVKAGDLYSQFLERDGEDYAFLRLPKADDKPAVLRLIRPESEIPIIGSDPYSRGRILYPQYFRLKGLRLFQDKVSDQKLEKFRRLIRLGETFGGIKMARDHHGDLFLYDGYHRALAAYLEGKTHLLGLIIKDHIRISGRQVAFEEIKIIPHEELEEIIRRNRAEDRLLKGLSPKEESEG